jgi:CubicO group peptidase (beta-lactamase class C family)
MPKWIVAIAVVFVGASLVRAQPPIPATPAGRVLTAWLSAFNSGDAAALQAFDAAHRPEAPPHGTTQRLRASTGGFTLIRIEKSTRTSVTTLLEENDARRLARLELEVTDDPTPLVVSSTLRIVPRTADVPLARLSEAQTIGALTASLEAQLKEDRFSGAVLVGQRGRIVFEKAVGFANRESRTPNTLDTQFRNGSMNKVFTATAAMQLVEAGRLSLDDTVGKLMPDYQNADVARKVTIRHLLGHTGGTGDFFGPEFLKNRLTLKTHADYVALFGARAPLHEPGAEFRYSNYGMLLLGAIIERVTGQSYFDYVRTRVFEPAGMTSTGSLPETDAVPNRSTGYMRSKDAWVPNTETLPWSGTAAGGGYSTVGDFFRFAEALQSGKLVSKASLAQMIAPGVNPQYGFGMALSGEGAKRSFGHAGGAPGMNGDLRVFQESGYVIVALSNLDPPAASRVADFIAARLPLASTPPRTAVLVDDFESGALAGWTLDRRGGGNWFSYRDGRQPPDPKQTNTFVPFHVPNPPQGKFAVVCDAPGPGMQLMYRDIEVAGPTMLELTVFYVSGSDGLSGYSAQFVTPRTLALNAGPNQQFRVDLLAPTAAADSMADADVRATVFETRPDAPARHGPAPVRYDLSPWAGQTLRLRIASAYNQAPLRAGIDDVRLVPIER